MAQIQDRFDRAADSLCRVRRARNEALMAEARTLAGVLSGIPTVLRVIVFGSVAMGRATATGDIDLALVAMVPGEWSRGERGMAMMKTVRPSRDVDLVVYTPDEFETLGAQNGPMKRAILDEGLVLFARG